MKVASIETELLINEIIKQIEIIKKLNPGIENIQEPKKRDGKLKKVLISNRGEIAKRFFLSLKEESIPSVAVVTDPDRGQSWYETADEVIFIGNAMNYVRIPTIIAAAILSKSNAIYPGYGFLSENPDFVDSIKIASEYFQREIIFMGPDSSIMRKVGNKLDARNLAKQYGVSLFEGTDSIQSLEQAYTEAERIGYPVIVKLNAGGGGKGMQAVFKKEDLAPAIESCRRIGKTLYDDDSFYLEKFIVNPVHIEVQIFNGLAVGLRKCAVQRRNQKIIEETGDTFLSNYTKLSFLAAAENMARISGYSNGGGAGTVEFLYDPDTDTYGFLEMNTRLQVEHPVTDQTLGIDLAKWQILLFDGREHEIPYEKVLERRFINQEHTIECRVYAEDPENQYSPTPGKIEDLDLPTFNGVRCDFGFRRGDRILPDYDPMIGKVIAWGSTRKEAVVRMERALNELYIRGVTSNLNQLLRIIRSDVFRKGDYSNRILLDYQELCYPVLEENLLIQCSIFSAITEYVRTIQEKVNELFQNRDLEVILNKAELFQLPDSYDAELYGNKYLIQFLQNGLEEFEVFVNEIYFGNIKFLPSLSIGDDYTVRYQNKTYTIRVDRRHAYNIVRFNDDEGKVHYYKVRISSKGDTGKKDPIGLIRSPIQGTFVKFMDDVRIGSKVKAGQPIIILSAMKMESTIKSPIDGTIEYLIENGDPNRLILSKTADGKIIGKSISEGEVLFYVKPDKIEVSNENETTYTKIHINPTTDNQEKLDYFIVSKKEEEIQSNIDTLFPSIIRILENIYLGFNIENKNLVNKIIHILKTLPKNYDISKIFNEKLFLDLILTYSEIKRLFSPLIVTKSSYFRETFRLFNNWENFSYQPSANYLFVINEIFKRYDVTDWRSTSEENQRISKKAFYFILRAFQATREYIEPILLILDIIGGFKRPSNALKNTLRKFVNQEEAEQDLTIAEKITETLSKLGISRWSIELVYWVSRKYLQDLRKITSDPLYYPHISREEIRKNIEESLKQPYNDLIPDNLIIKPLTRKVLEKKIQFLGNRYTIQRLYSPISNVLIYLLKEGEKEFYFVFGIVEKVIPTYDKDGNLVGSENVEIANINAVKVLNSYQSINKKHGNYLDIIVVDEELILDLSSESKIIFNYDVLTNMMFRLLPFFNDPAITNNIVSVTCKTPNSEELIEKQFYVTQKEKKVILNILTDENPISPYFNPKTEDTKTSHVYRLGKWPVELWVRECFDVGSYKEIRIPGIDYQNTPDEVIPVGSKIYEGKMNKIPAIFYLKDSRISGGATGDLEGLKYVAACWLASVKGYPLYVFNDGAGANIRQGMVSLNRAAEGFFMNALIGGNYSPKKIYEYIKIHDDGKILEVINKINQMLSIKEEELPTTPNTFIVAVGVGSSTGLDVYGSSQAAIQVMVDDEQSYRVLTGSAVIKSVTGEDLTNYEIGGARVMSRLTGTVDLVARSNIHLLVILKSIHELFAKGQKLQTIQRKPIDYKTKLNPDDVLNADIIRANSDHGKYIPFKEEYYGSGALIGGFAKIAGRPILIMGPRNRFGLRSYQSLLRAIDLLITARKLNSDQIIVVGDEWFIETPRTDSLTLRARQDFLKLMTIKAGTRIHIATTVRGLQKIMLHSGADALIFIRNRSFSEKEEEFIKNSSTHVVHSYEEAFDLSLKIIQLLSEKNESEKIIPPSKEPIIPENPAMPFDIIENVISRVFDEGTFIEWWKEMNDPQKGPSLITGFAKLNGKTVGILADQPAILGGAPDAPGTEKFRIFTELIERNKVPLIMISNAPGFLPGTKQERLRIQQIGGRSLDVNVLSTIPVVSVTLNQNYGGRQIHAFSKFLRPCIISFSLKNSILAVMGADSAFDLFYGKKYNELKSQGKHQEAEEMRSNYIKDFNEKAKAENDAYKTNVLDFMIEDIKELRQALIKGLDMAIEKNKLLENVIC